MKRISILALVVLLGFVNTESIAAERAENILCFFYNLCKSEIGSPKSNSLKIKKPTPAPDELYENLNSVKVAPNPANTYIEFEYTMLMPSENSVLRVIDMQGKPVIVWKLGSNEKGIKVFDTSKMANGVYLYELLQDGENLKSGKFIIQH